MLREATRNGSKAGAIALAPMGIALSVVSARSELLAAAAATCRGWEGTPASGAPALHLRIFADRIPTRAEGCGIRADGERLSVIAAVGVGWADARTGEAACTVSEAALADEAAICEALLEPLILFLVTQRDRTPLHASGFVVDNMAVLLAGPSGAGKSCLALAAQRAGLALLSDDMVHVQLEPALRIWGVPRPIHVFVADDPDGTGPIRIRNGKHKRTVTVAQGAPTTASSAALCVLRAGEKVSLEPIGHDEALLALGPLEPGFDLLQRQGNAVRERLTRHGAWRLTLSRDPKMAIELLIRNLGRLLAAAI